MFVGWYSSDGSRPGFGCFGLPLLIVPLLCLFSGFNNSPSLLMILLMIVFALFIVPRLFAFSGPAPAEADYDKPKHDEYRDKSKNDEYLDKPKRDEDYIVRADGELLDVIDEENPNSTQPPLDGGY
jgi:hypothetical protein